MIYAFLRIVIPVAIRIFYKNFYIRNGQNLPYNVPVIIASNHPNAVVDACAITAFTKQWSYYLARSDVFKNNFVKWFLKQLRIIPIYRLQEGAENLHLNQITFQKCFELLKKKKTILIFPEGICVQERRLRKLKKGTARIAFSAEENSNWQLGLMVVPVGINYSDPKKFRSNLVINYGKPIEVKDFRDAYMQDRASAINEFTKFLENKLSELVVHINNKENDQLVADIETVYKKQLSKEESFIATQKIVKAVNYLSQTYPEKINVLKNKIRSYLSQVEALKIRDWVIQ
jgi:1-acyl-sn-glycerol-3-phosphate acyltransferase